MMKRAGCAYILLLVLTVSALAAGGRKMTIEDALALQEVGAPQWSPDGKLIAFTVSEWNRKENRRDAHIYIIPAAMGAKVGRPDETVICVSGDGSIQMNAQELATCADNGIAVKVFIMNNGYLGMVRQWQELFWERRYSHVEMGGHPDFVKLADAYGCTGLRVEDKGSLDGVVREALATDGPVVVDVRVTAEENVYPMIAPGAAARDMVG